MGRNWSPKYKCNCISCSWRGKRTSATMHYPCPSCGGKVGKMIIMISHKITPRMRELYSQLNKEIKKLKKKKAGKKL